MTIVVVWLIFFAALAGAAGGPANSGTMSGGQMASPEQHCTTRADLHCFRQSALTGYLRSQSQAMTFCLKNALPCAY